MVVVCVPPISTHHEKEIKLNGGSRRLIFHDGKHFLWIGKFFYPLSPIDVDIMDTPIGSFTFLDHPFFQLIIR